MGWMFRVISAALIALSSSAVQAEEQFEPLNSTLIAKVYLDRNPSRSQMVGAYQIAFRPANGGYINSLTVLLNPGLRIEKIVGTGNLDLVFRSSVTPIAGMDGLELRVAEIDLPTTLLGTNRSEIVIHYRGTLEDLSRYGVEGARDQLNIDFSMLRAKAFAYPVFAKGNKSDIEHVWLNTRLSQVAFIELPETHTVAGSLQIAEKTLSGNKINFELKAAKPSSLMSVAIAPYQTLNDGPISIVHFNESSAGALKLRDQLDRHYESIVALLGEPGKGVALQIVEVPEGTQTLPSNTAVFVAGPLADNAQATVEMRGKIDDFWRINARNRPNHWADGLDHILSAALSGNLPVTSARLFETAKAALKANKAIGKTPLEDFLAKGLETEQAPMSALAYAVLHDMLGERGFFALIRAIRTEAASGYADMATIAEVMNSTIKDKKARKFVKGWFTGKKIGRALSKASSFDDLVAQTK